uniref:Core Histone H2A/H2B/H3 domain-containing protein n=1 Tax=Otolemur garnettii TaxID=30611 RepID=H0XR91_OTOGA
TWRVEKERPPNPQTQRPLLSLSLEAVYAMAEPSCDMWSGAACPGAKEPQEAESSMTQKKQPGRRSRRSSRKGASFATYFPRILKRVHEGLSLSVLAISILDSFVRDIFEQIAQEAGSLARYRKCSTITPRDLETALRLMLPGDIGTYAVSVGNKAISRYALSNMDKMEK